jgi:hypothetical protein
MSWQRLTQPDTVVKRAYIKRMFVNTEENDMETDFSVMIILIVGDNEYHVRSIKHSEQNINILWNKYEYNREIEIEQQNRDGYVIVKVLGLTVALKQVDSNKWVEV